MKQTKITIILNQSMPFLFEDDVNIILSDPQAFGSYKSFSEDRVTVEEIEVEEPLFKFRDRITRKAGGGNGTILKVYPDGRCYIRWDSPARTGQQHSTVNQKKLKAA